MSGFQQQIGVIQDLHEFVDLVGAEARRCTGVANVTKVMGTVQGEQHRNQLGFTEDQCRVAIDSDLYFVGAAVQHRSLRSKLRVSEGASARRLQGHRISVRSAATTRGFIHRRACCPSWLSVVEGEFHKQPREKDQEQPIGCP